MTGVFRAPFGQFQGMGSGAVFQVFPDSYRFLRGGNIVTDFAREVIAVTLEDEMRKSYLDYAMSVIVGRALPDIRDGLKPVHRRVLYAMSELGNDHNKPYKKSARVVGDVIGKYHPHGDTAVYDTIVRMAQPFSLRYLLVDGQGNFGSIDGDSPAAMRYTEVRMTRLVHELLSDLDKETVDFAPNYDNSEQEPTVLPTRVPNLLVNGSSGIAVGMATNIPPHNLSEVITAALALIDNPGVGIDELIEHLPGPDFPTAGFICGRRGIHQAYRTGRGSVVMRARCAVETDHRSGRERIVVSELPYMVNKAALLEKIAELVRGKRIEGIAELRDESDKEGIRVAIDLKRGQVGEVVLNNLYRYTKLQSVFGINMVALSRGQPLLANLKQVLEAFVRHRRDVVTRRSVFELRKAREKAHVLEGQAVALASVDEVIALIKASRTPADARQALMEKAWPPGAVTGMLQRAGDAGRDREGAGAGHITRPDDLALEFGLSDEGYRLSRAQAQAILDLRLNRLTALEQDRIIVDYKTLIERIRELLEVLSDPDRLTGVIRGELIEIRERYGDDRRTEIIEEAGDFEMEDLIPEEDVVVTLSHGGYAKYQAIDTYRAQRRGGKGKSATSVKEEDFVDKLFIASTHDTLLCFSTHGKVYWLKVYRLPESGRTARGRPLVNMLPLEDGERVSSVLPVKSYDSDRYVVMATAKGTVKKIELVNFSRPRNNGIIALRLKPGDELIGTEVIRAGDHVMLFSDSGRAVRFHESGLRAIGRVAAGVRGIRLRDEDRVISLLVTGPDAGESGKRVLVATMNGYGKCTELDEFPVRKRGGQGVISIKTTPRNGRVAAAIMVDVNSEVILITTGGKLVRTRVDGISTVGRNTQGVRLIRLSGKQKLVEVEPVVGIDGTESGLAEGVGTNA